MSFTVVRLHPQKHRRIQSGHPWIYSNEIVMDSATKALPSGILVAYYTHDKKFIGIGSFNINCLIAGRIFTRNVLDEVNEDWFIARLKEALHLRQQLISDPFYRLVHAEADGLPGLIIDRFDDILSVQLNAAGMDRLWPNIETALQQVIKPRSIILRNDSYIRTIEGLPRETKLIGEKVGTPVILRENGLAYFADLVSGQKTGWYFDQRDNHALVARYAQKLDCVLDLFTHAGGFALAAALAGAKKTVGVDSSESALALARQAATYNKLDGRCDFLRADIFEDLERRISIGEKHSMVIADPPAFVKSRKDLASGSRAYRKLTKLTATVTQKNGFLFVASCSHNMTLENFAEQVAAGLYDAKRIGKIIHTCFAATDHPIHPHMPESSYLKGFLIYLSD